MEPHTTIIAGERIEDLEAALDFLEFEADECGCVHARGPIPDDLHRCLMRALTTLEAELDEQGLCACIDEKYQPIQQLFMRIGAVRNAQP